MSTVVGEGALETEVRRGGRFVLGTSPSFLRSFKYLVILNHFLATQLGERYLDEIYVMSGACLGMR